MTNNISNQYIQRVYCHQVLHDNLAKHQLVSATTSFLGECVKIVLPTASLLMFVAWLIN